MNKRASYDELVNNLLELIGITSRKSTYLPDQSNGNIPFDQLGKTQKKLFGIFAKNLCDEVLFTLYPADNNVLKKEV